MQRDPYGLPVVQPPYGVDNDRGPDPRRIIAETLKLVGQWDHIDYSDIIDDVLAMNPAADECGLCNEADCEPGCPLTRWRGQA